jgi:AraC-like DNA-binding protein
MTEFLLENKNLPLINPYKCGYQHCPPGHTPGFLVRDYWLMHYVVSGKGKYVERGTVHEVSAGECFIIRPMEIANYCADEKEPWHYIWIAFTAEIPLPELFDESVIDGKAIADVFLSFPKLEEGRKNLEEHLAGKIFEIISLLSVHNEAKNRANSIVETAKNIIETSYDTINVTKLSEKMHLSRTYLSSVFKRSEGVTLQQYLQSFRLRKAATFIKEMNMSPGQAGNAVGFSDIYSFSRAFKNYFKISPTAFKRRAAELDAARAAMHKRET